MQPHLLPKVSFGSVDQRVIQLLESQFSSAAWLNDLNDESGEYRLDDLQYYCPLQINVVMHESTIPECCRNERLNQDIFVTL